MSRFIATLGIFFIDIYPVYLDSFIIGKFALGLIQEKTIRAVNQFDRRHTAARCGEGSYSDALVCRPKR